MNFLQFRAGKAVIIKRRFLLLPVKTPFLKPHEDLKEDK